MENLTKVGRIFYSTAIAVLGFQTIYYKDFPYMLIPPNHSRIPGLLIISYIFGSILTLAGICILFQIKTRPITLLLGGVLLLIFCFYYIPYELLATSNYMHLGEWDNAEKELALSSGAFVIAGGFSKTNENSVVSFLSKLIPFGSVLFSLTIISFGIDHFLYANVVSEYIPSWIPNRIFWTYLAGTALFGSGIGILVKIKVRLMAALLGTMILIWFIILHIPKAIASPVEDMGGEITSAFLALAYCGIAFVIAGLDKKLTSTQQRDIGSIPTPGN